jgi:hypothetical protein
MPPKVCQLPASEGRQGTRNGGERGSATAQQQKGSAERSREGEREREHRAERPRARAKHRGDRGAGGVALALRAEEVGGKWGKRGDDQSAKLRRVESDAVTRMYCQKFCTRLENTIHARAAAAPGGIPAPRAAQDGKFVLQSEALSRIGAVGAAAPASGRKSSTNKSFARRGAPARQAASDAWNTRQPGPGAPEHPARGLARRLA